MTVVKDTPHLNLFKLKIDEAVNYVPKMNAMEQLKAVQFWNMVSEKLQDIVNSCAADINAFSLKTQESISDKIIDEKNCFRPITSVPISSISSDFINLSSSYVNCSGISEQYHSADISGAPLLTHESTFSIVRESVKNNSSVDAPFIHHLENAMNTCEKDISDDYVKLESLTENSCDTLEIESCAPSYSKSLDCSSPTDSSSKEISHEESQQTFESSSSVKDISCISYSNDNLSLESSEELLISNHKNETVPEKSKCKRFSSTKSSEKNKMKFQNKSDCDVFDVCGDSVDSVKSDSERSLNSGESDSNYEKSIVSFVVSNSEEMLAKNDLTSDLISNQEDGKQQSSRSYCCSDCPAKFATKANLNVHMRRHTGEKPYACNKCAARFTTKGNLKRHLKTHTGEKPFECTNCGSRFTEKKSLTVHMRRHTGEKPYECKECGKRFAQSGILQTHMAMHLNLKFHLCEHCGKSFRQRSQLQTHKLRHANIRNYSCDSCPSRFLTKGDLERHVRVHTGERPYVCHMCPKSYTRQQSLNEHYNRHYNLRPYSCKYCSKTFSEMSACHKHIKLHKKAGADDSSILSTESSAELPKSQDSSEMNSMSASSELTKLPGYHPKEEHSEENNEGTEANQSLTTLMENYFH